MRSGLVSFAHQMHLARVSMWSANRDSQCGAQVLDEQVSNTCSGVKQKPLAFTWELGRLNGHLPVRVTRPGRGRMPRACRRATTRQPARTRSGATSKAYKAGDEIVWHQRVYEAKWFTQGDFPDAPVAHLWDTPWRYIGPILSSDAQPSTTSATALLAWNVDQVYLAGNTGAAQRPASTRRSGGRRPTSRRTIRSTPTASPWQVVGKAPATAARAGHHDADGHAARDRRRGDAGERRHAGVGNEDRAK